MMNHTFLKKYNCFSLILTFALVVVSAAEPVLAAKPATLMPPSTISAQAISQTVINLTWGDNNTSENGYSIERKTAQQINFSVVVNTDANITSFTDNTLTSGTTYQYRIRAFKTQKNTISYSNYSSIASATTLAGDIISPTISLYSPTDNSSYNTAQTVTVKANVSDNVDISKVEIFDNSILLSTLNSAPFNFNFPVDSSKNGTHVFTAKAYDSNNNGSISNNVTIEVAIDDVAPNVSISNPVNGVTYTAEQSVNISAAASDNVGIVKVEFYDNGILRSTDMEAPFSFGWAVTGADNGAHAWNAIAYDGAGNQATAPLINVEVNIVNDNVPVSPEQVVDAGMLGPNSALQMKGRMTEYNGTRAMIYSQGFTGQKWLYLWTDAGEESWLYLPGLDNDMIFNGEYVFTAANEFWLFSSNGSPAFGVQGAPAVARRYQLSGNGSLPNTAVLAETQSFGDQSTAAGSLIRLQSGALVAAWYSMPINSTVKTATVNFAYRGINGVWTVPANNISVDAWPNHWHRLTLAQHPVDGGIWAFSKGDGFEEIWAVHMTETADGLSFDWVNNQFISQTLDGLDGPEGELPSLVAIPDSFKGKLLLAYQNHDFKIFSASPFVKGAKVSIARIDAGGSRDFIRFPAYVERVHGLGGIVVKPDALWLAYRPIDQSTFAYNDVYANHYSLDTWENPQFIGTTYTNGNLHNRALMAYGTDRAQFAISLGDYNIHLFTLD
jgi:hypothetical protein